jgi:hypothetical protein
LPELPLPAPAAAAQTGVARCKGEKGTRDKRKGDKGPKANEEKRTCETAPDRDGLIWVSVVYL